VCLFQRRDDDDSCEQQPLQALSQSLHMRIAARTASSRAQTLLHCRLLTVALV